jgi:hypothetical protein
MAIYVVVAVTAAVEHQPHQTAANHEGENDAEDHSYVAMNAHLYVDANRLAPFSRAAEKFPIVAKRKGRR